MCIYICIYLYIFTYLYVCMCVYRWNSGCVSGRAAKLNWWIQTEGKIGLSTMPPMMLLVTRQVYVHARARVRARACVCVCVFICVCVYICMVCRRAHAHIWICISWDSLLARRNCMLSATHACVTRTDVTYASFMCDMAYSYVWHDPHTDTRVHIMYSHMNTASAAYATRNCACRGDDPHK